VRGGPDPDVLTKTWRQGAAILLDALIMSRGAAPQAVSGDSPAAALHSPSSITADQSRESPLPANLIVPDVVLPLVLSMWRDSPTFRRQCARLAEHAEVIVRLDLVREREGRARSRLERRDAGFNVAVQIELRTPTLYVEHIAHEVEHVLEHLDGTDLPRLERQRLDGVVSLDGGYETARARAVGQMVAREALRR
jgi:hypothetical protein